MKLSRWLLGTFLVILIATGCLQAEAQQPAVSLNDLVGWIQIKLYSISPDGQRVAYLSVKALPRDNVYEVVLNLTSTNGGGVPVVLARYRLTTTDVMDPSTGGIIPDVGQFAWSPDGAALIYTVHAGSRMEIRKRIVKNGLERKLLPIMADRILLGKSDKMLELTTSSAQPGKEPATRPPNDALRIKDGYRVNRPFGNPKANGKSIVQHWSYRWGESSVVMAKQDPPAYLKMPPELSVSPIVANDADTFRYTGAEIPSPDGTAVAMVERAREPAPSRRSAQILLKLVGSKDAKARVLVPDVQPRPYYDILGWSGDSKQVYYVNIGQRSSSVNAVDTDGRVTQILNDASALFVPFGSAAVDKEGTMVVLVRSTNTMPDELVVVDLKTGELKPLALPNAVFETKARPVIRFIPVEGNDGADAYGRLYLPADHRAGTRYPLLITQYSSWPGFVQSTGDELPIQVLVANGIAVLAMRSDGYNMTSTTGNFQFEINRVARPLATMEWFIRKLTDEGIIDPDRVGLQGLSFGSDIAMFAYWKSRAFRAFASAGGSLGPTLVLGGGPVRAKQLQLRGFGPPEDPNWKRLAAGHNARPDLPPLLLQTSDHEVFVTVETWTRLREAGAQVEWWQYPDEGHVKSGPANKWWVYQRNLDWFRFWLKDEEDPDASKKEQYARWRQMREKWELAKREQKTQTQQ